LIEEKNDSSLPKDYPINTLLQAIIDAYVPMKGKASPTYSYVMRALTQVNEECQDFRVQEKLYQEGILLNILYHAEVPKSMNNMAGKKCFESHVQFKREAILDTPFNTSELEERFLYFYQQRYFSKRTITALAVLEAKIKADQVKTFVVKKASNEASTLKEVERARRTSIASVNSIPSVASTVLYPTAEIEQYANGEMSELSDKQEYRLFRESYAILLMLKIAEQNNKPLLLNDKQFKFYTEILNGFLLGFSAEQSLKLYQDLMQSFEFDEKIKKKIEKCKRQLNKNFPRVLSEELDLDITLDTRRKIIARMIELKATSSRLIIDDRLNQLLITQDYHSEEVCVEDDNEQNKNISFAAHPNVFFNRKQGSTAMNVRLLKTFGRGEDKNSLAACIVS
jgi:hypothetical protein